ncbi:MAG: methyltransferase domain-containing protein [Nitrospiraceae bacterium]
MTAHHPAVTDFKTRDASSYNAVAQSFDRLVAHLSAPIAARLVELAKLGPEERVLDVGTGTGIVALHAARMEPSGKVTGVDLSAGMLAVARRNATRGGLSGRVEFRRMDAESLAFANASFHAVVSLFALRHFPHPETALREMHRVLRPDGRLVLAVGSGAPWLSVRGVVHRLKLLPQLLRRLRGKQLVACAFLDGLVGSYIPTSRKAEEAAWTQGHRPMTQSVPALLRDAGFQDVRWEWRGQQTIVTTAEEFWELQTTLSSLSRKRLAEASPEVVERVRQKFMTTCREVVSHGGELVYPSGALVVSARRPQDGSLREPPQERRCPQG